MTLTVLHHSRSFKPERPGCDLSSIAVTLTPNSSRLALSVGTYIRSPFWGLSPSPVPVLLLLLPLRHHSTTRLIPTHVETSSGRTAPPFDT